MQLESRRAATKTQALKSLKFSQETTPLTQSVQLFPPPETNPSSQSWRVNHRRIKPLAPLMQPLSWLSGEEQFKEQGLAFIKER